MLKIIFLKANKSEKNVYFNDSSIGKYLMAHSMSWEEVRYAKNQFFLILDENYRYCKLALNNKKQNKEEKCYNHLELKMCMSSLNLHLRGGICVLEWS